MKLALYYAPVTCAMVPYITLMEAGAQFDVRPLNFAKGQHMSPDFLAINPKHKVPVLSIDEKPLTENVAIQIWIARHFSEARLLPSDAFEEIKAISFMAWCASGIHPNLTPQAFPQWFCDAPGSDESVRRLAQKRMLENLQIAEQMLNGQDWFFGHFTAADAYFFWCFRRAAQTSADLAGLKNCVAHHERMEQRPSVKKTLAFEAKLLAEWQAKS
jgi:glutathione S-transferase